MWIIAGVVISNRFNAKTKPHLYEKCGLVISPWKPLGYGLSFGLFPGKPFVNWLPIYVALAKLL